MDKTIPNDESKALIINTSGSACFRESTNAATLCGAIVRQTAKPIQGRKYVSVEGWQAIAIAHGCTASARDVEKVDGGFRAIGEVRRMSDGQLIAQAEGFLGDDETMWAKRPVFARRAMVQTRAISRACRSAFAHVVVMVDADLGTTPAEEMEAAVVVENVKPVESAKQEQKRPAWTPEQKAEAKMLIEKISAIDMAKALDFRDMAKDKDTAPSDLIDGMNAWITNKTDTKKG